MGTYFFVIIAFVMSVGTPNVSAELPDSPFVVDAQTGLSPDFCSLWDPDFGSRGGVCCNFPGGGRSRKGKRNFRGRGRCGSDRIRGDYCQDRTAEQILYTERVESGEIVDILTEIELDAQWKGKQDFCTVNNGFLAYGRPVLPTKKNRIQLRSPKRCTNFGSDPMVALLEWTGQQIAIQYPDQEGVKLTVGDVSAPRGGCLSGRGGRKGHASHTSGMDADLAFLEVYKNKPSPVNFGRKFQPDLNWWLVKQMFRNPYACIKAIFLDRRLISKLSKEARLDGSEEWPKWGDVQRFIRHVRGHRNHFHIRIGDGPGKPGCEADPEFESELEFEESEGDPESDTPDVGALDAEPKMR